jgi:hypothetical protein
VHVTNGVFDACYQLAAIVVKASDSNVGGYDDTTNSGGEYKVWVCSSAGFENSTCKTDNFKVKLAPTPTPPPAAEPPTLTKNASGTYDNKYTWSVDKNVDKTTIKQVGGSVTFIYTVDISNDGGKVNNVKVTGQIVVSNPNGAAIAITGVTDQLSDSTVCAVTGGGAQDLQPGDTPFAYTCLLSGLPTVEITNKATVTWSEQPLSDASVLAGVSADFTTEAITFTETKIDECGTATDSYAGTLGVKCVGDANPTHFIYSRTVPVPQFGCQSYDNTATFTTNDTGATPSDSQTVNACGPVQTGALTIGFWQNKNGQAIITGGASTAGVCNSATWLRQYAPFQALSATATCKDVSAYVTSVIKAANASGAAMNAMLEAQMLATALDVYFSDPALGGNKIGASTPIGGVLIDLTQVCKNIPGCTIYEKTSDAFGGASYLSVSGLLSFAASQSNSGGTTWYVQVKAVQEHAKDTFDAINNQVAFAW